MVRAEVLSDSEEEGCLNQVAHKEGDQNHDTLRGEDRQELESSSYSKDSEETELGKANADEPVLHRNEALGVSMDVLHHLD